MKKMGDKFGTAVRGDMSQNAMLGEDVENEELFQLRGRDCIMSQDKRQLL